MPVEYKSVLKRPLKVYIATKLQNLSEAKHVAESINATGYHQCNSRWINAEYPPVENPEEKTRRMRDAACQDLQDIWECDIFLLLPDPPSVEFNVGSYDKSDRNAGSASVSRFVELGIAIGLKKVVCIVGQDAPTIFKLLDFVRTYATVEGFVSNLTPLSEKNWLFLQQTPPLSEAFLAECRANGSFSVTKLVREIDRLNCIVDSLPKKASIGVHGVL